MPSFSRMWSEPVPKLSSPQIDNFPASMRFPKNFQPVGTWTQDKRLSGEKHLYQCKTLFYILWSPLLLKLEFRLRVAWPQKMEDSIFQPHDLEHHLLAWTELNPEIWKQDIYFLFLWTSKRLKNICRIFYLGATCKVWNGLHIGSNDSDRIWRSDKKPST